MKKALAKLAELPGQLERLGAVIDDARGGKDRNAMILGVVEVPKLQHMWTADGPPRRHCGSATPESASSRR